MDLESSGVKLKLTEEEARVAVAFLGDSETSKLLKTQIAEHLMTRMVMRVGIGNVTDEDSDQLMRAQTPDLFEYNLPYAHRASLLGAFTLGALESQELPQADILLGLESGQIRLFASSARDTLLRME